MVLKHVTKCFLKIWFAKVRRTSPESAMRTVDHSRGVASGFVSANMFFSLCQPLGLVSTLHPIALFSVGVAWKELMRI